MGNGQYGTRKFRLTALTPIHMGTGERLSAEEYIYDEPRQMLVRLSLTEFIRMVRKEYRDAFEAHLDNGRIEKAQAMLVAVFRGVQPEFRKRLVRHETRVGTASAAEFRELHSRQRSGEIFTMLRNPYSNRVTIPGSGLKGAIRTAVVSQLNGGRANAIQRDRLDEGTILGYTSRTLEDDPFRLMRVSDAEWPLDGISIDRAILRKLGRDDGMASIQIHEERLLGRTDGFEGSAVVEIDLQQPPERPLRERRSTGAPLSWSLLTDACNGFYQGRLNAEQGQFPFLRENRAQWEPGVLGPDRILLRVGKHCHFDSMSIDGERMKPARGGAERHDIGSTRTVCRIAEGQEFPYGWALLESLATGQLS